MNVLDYVKPELLVLIPVLFFVGLGIKKSDTPDKHIPLILGGVGILLAVLYVLATSEISTYQHIALAIFTAITQGILTAGCSVYFNELNKQKGREE